MNILITTGIFPPDPGGSATYAAKLASGLARAGHDVTVLTMADAKNPSKDGGYDFTLTRITRGGKLSNYVRYLWGLLSKVRQADVVYTLNYFTYGFMTALVSKVFGTPYVVRVGGGYLWEHFYLYENDPIPLAKFYADGLHKQYPFKLRILRFVLSGARQVVFNSDRQAQLYQKPFGLSAKQTTVVHNPVPKGELDHSRNKPNKEIVYAGRLTPMKNVSALIEAFAQADLPEYRLIIIGDGPTEGRLSDLVEKLGIVDRVEFMSSLPQNKLFARIIDARLTVLPSWTDISPNFVFECRSLGIPALVSEENYLPFRDELPQMIDPDSVADIANKLSLLTQDDAAYNRFVDAFMEIDFAQSWKDVVSSHIKLFKAISE